MERKDDREKEKRGRGRGNERVSRRSEVEMVSDHEGHGDEGGEEADNEKVCKREKD